MTASRNLNFAQATFIKNSNLSRSLAISVVGCITKYWPSVQDGKISRILILEPRYCSFICSMYNSWVLLVEAPRIIPEVSTMIQHWQKLYFFENS